jgi:hypothetical protein
MNELNDQLQARKLRLIIFDMIIIGGIVYAMYTYIWPMLSTYIH